MQAHLPSEKELLVCQPEPLLLTVLPSSASPGQPNKGLGMREKARLGVYVTYYMLSAVLSSLHFLTHLTLTTRL